MWALMREVWRLDATHCPGMRSSTFESDLYHTVQLHCIPCSKWIVAMKCQFSCFVHKSILKFKFWANIWLHNVVSLRNLMPNFYENIQSCTRLKRKKSQNLVVQYFFPWNYHTKWGVDSFPPPPPPPPMALLRFRVNKTGPHWEVAHQGMLPGTVWYMLGRIAWTHP